MKNNNGKNKKKSKETPSATSDAVQTPDTEETLRQPETQVKEEAGSTEPLSPEETPAEVIGKKLEHELEEAKKDVLYFRAEMENTRKRLLRDQEQKIQFANESLVKELLPVVDVFDRALLAASDLKKKVDHEELDGFLSGIEATYRQLTQILGKFDVVFIGNPGEEFDPKHHEAVFQKETDEEPPNRVVEVFQKGCLLRGRLLKPAKVVVSKMPEKSGKQK